MEGNLRWKITFDGDNLRWKTPFDEWHSWVEDNHRRKMTLVDRQPLMEEDLRWKTTFNEKQPAINTCKNAKPCEITCVQNKELFIPILQQILRALKMLNVTSRAALKSTPKSSWLSWRWWVTVLGTVVTIIGWLLIILQLVGDNTVDGLGPSCRYW